MRSNLHLIWNSRPVHGLGTQTWRQNVRPCQCVQYISLVQEAVYTYQYYIINSATTQINTEPTTTIYDNYAHNHAFDQINDNYVLYCITIALSILLIRSTSLDLFCYV